MKYRRLLLSKLELWRIAVERRSIHVENQKTICEVHSATFLLPDRGLLKRFVGADQMQNLAAAKSTVHLQNIRLNTRKSCTVLSVELLFIWNTNYDGSSSTFIDIPNVNVVDVCVYPLLGLTVSKKQLHCWQSMCKTVLLLMVVGVEDSAFIVDSRCRRPTFRCQQSMSSLMSTLQLILCSKFTTHSHKHTQNVTLQMSLSIIILTVYCYRFKLLSFSTEMKDGSKQN